MIRRFNKGGSRNQQCIKDRRGKKLRKMRHGAVDSPVRYCGRVCNNVEQTKFLVCSHL